MSYQSHEYYLRRAIEISKEARAAGNTPFGALLVNKDGDIVMEQGNIEITDKICTGPPPWSPKELLRMPGEAGRYRTH